MAAGLGFKTFTSGEVLTAADTNGYLMQGILVFASASARSAAITSPQEGQYSYLKDTNSTEYYDGAAWVSGVEGDISGVTAGTGITGGGTSGTVTVSFDQANFGGAQGAAGKNKIINGGFDIWQRGTTFSIGTSTTTYTADRYLGYRSSAVTGMTVSRSTDAPTGFTYSAKVQRDVGVTTTNNLNFRQALESQPSRYLAGKTVVVSFYAKAGANYSSASNALVATLYSGTGTDQSNGSMTSWTGVTTVAAVTSNITTSWVRYSMTGTVASNANQIGLTFANTPVGTAGADDSYLITGMQIEEGSTATPFQTASGGSLQGELALCQRYYYRVGTAINNAPIGGGIASGATTAGIAVFSPVPMRTAPTSIDAANLATTDFTAFTNAITAPSTIAIASATSVRIDLTGGSGMTLKAPVYLVTNGTSGYLGLSAEL